MSSGSILLFGITKDIVGDSKLQIDIPESITVGELKLQLLQNYPQLTRLNSLLIAVNQQYATDDQQVRATDEIALIPPVSGG